MLFDLRGRRRRMIRVMYALLAGSFLVGFVIFYVGSGTNVGGSVLDAFRGGGGSGVGDQVKKYRKRVDQNPADRRAWIDLMNAQFQLARAPKNYDQQKGQPTQEGTKVLSEFAQSWGSYMALKPEKVPLGTAAAAVTVFSELNRFDKAAEAQTLVIERQANSNNFYRLALLAYQGGQTRKGDLAAARAIDLAPKSDRKQVKRQIKDAKQQIQAQAAQTVAKNQGAGGN